MALFNTNLSIVAAQLPPDFSGSPADLFRAFVERLSIVSPVGTNFFVVGDIEPTTNVGPWLKGGTAWYVFSESQGKYVPADITASTTSLFVVSEATPANPTTGDAVIWIRTKGNRVLGWYFWDGTIWRPDGQTPPSGTTAQRPTDPNDLEQFWDTTCNCLVHYERGQWRTVSGTPGDVKYVTGTVLSDALAINPGWQYLGESDPNLRGRVIGIATKDPGATPAISYATTAGISARAAADLAGAETVTLADAEIPQHTHLVGTVNALGNNKNANFYRVDNGQSLTAPNPGVPNNEVSTGALHDSGTGPVAPASAGCALVTSLQLSSAIAPTLTAAATAHANVQPTLFLWALVKL